jgi:N,N'-diacetyllegionaminate synthase
MMPKMFHGSKSMKFCDEVPPYIILEAGINHNGDVNLAFQMIKLAKDLGADAIKFQTFKASEFCGNKEQLFTYRSQGSEVTEPMLDMFTRYEFTREEWFRIANRCQELEITFLSTPQNLTDLQLLNEIGIPAIKVGSDDLTNTPLIRSYAEFNKPIILSSGMSNLKEIFAALEAAGWFLGKDVSVLICTSLYPTYAKDAGVSRVRTLINAFPGLRVGFSDHTIGNTAAILALALGARIFEKHFTLDHNLAGPDHWFSASPDEIEMWIFGLREGWVSLGDAQLQPLPSELLNKAEFQRRVTATLEIQPGEIFSSKNIGLRRVSGGVGYPPEYLDLVLGRTSHKRYSVGEAIEI